MMKYAYYKNSEFIFNDYVGDYVCQVKLPYKYYREKYSLVLLDNPVACYKSVFLKELVGENSEEVLYSEHRLEHDETNALLSSLIMERGL